MATPYPSAIRVTNLGTSHSWNRAPLCLPFLDTPVRVFLPSPAQVTGVPPRGPPGCRAEAFSKPGQDFQKSRSGMPQGQRLIPDYSFREEGADFPWRLINGPSGWL